MNPFTQKIPLIGHNFGLIFKPFGPFFPKSISGRPGWRPVEAQKDFPPLRGEEALWPRDLETENRATVKTEGKQASRAV
jgi:hypothetical protein